MSILQLENVSRFYGSGSTSVCALKNVSLTVEPGETVALVGTSGSGKTTLLNLAAGLDRPSEGNVLLMGQSLADFNEARRARLRRTCVGFVFQALNLIPWLNISENIQLPLAMVGQAGAERIERASSLLASAGLETRARAFPQELSAGEQQRVAALRAMAHRPKLVLMDEPTSCLDTQNAGILMELVVDLNRDEGVTVILATHDPRVAGRLQRVTGLCDGQVTDDAANV